MIEEKPNKRSFSTETRCILLLITLVLTAYTNSYSGQLVFDDIGTIMNNPDIRSLWPLSKVMFSPRRSTIRGRLIAALTMALDYALFGDRTAGYHLSNLAIHLLASLTLFGIVRRTLLTERLRARFGEHATVLAWFTAAIWAVHPIQTESVTYIVQRCESLMGLFYLLTLYSVIRAIQSRRAVAWSIVSVLCCGLGMATKQVMVTAPVVILLYDRTFWTGSLVSALRRRWGLHAGLAGTWMILAALMWVFPARPESVGFSTAASMLDYMMNQCIVIIHYIRLSLWPARLCFDYSWPIVKDWNQLMPPMLMIVTLLAITAWGVVRNASWSFLGVWFFGILAPTSSFVPIVDLVFEHRMYLSLAALVLLFVITAYIFFQYAAKRLHLREEASTGTMRDKLIRYMSVIFMMTILASLILRTLYRNADYSNPVLLFKKSIDVSPNNPRAYVSLGYAFHQQSKLDRAAECYRQALRLKSPKRHRAAAEHNLGLILTEQGQFDQAMEHFSEALRLRPDMENARFGIAWILATHPNSEHRDPGRAVELAERAMGLAEWPGAWHFDRLAAAYAAAGRFEQAQMTAKKALVLASKEHNDQMAGEIRERLELYKQAIPYRESVRSQNTSMSDPQNVKD